ncbi:MAG TPA: hypothetical protein ENH10_08375 [Bacteroidetes bacterium]|nr:hypothetical protein BMS3Bbin04_00786 [bacterium BMS3Bbin04]HDO66025.1 hypothetical protein [Bacteroidota bacterium]HEX05150.1 hypothetical protein [Bacteroidota bacterium]
MTEQQHPSGFTLWLRSTVENELTNLIVNEIEAELGRRGMNVELVDAAKLARQAYVSKSSKKDIALAIAMTADALTRHGIVCLIHGARSSAHDFAWRKRTPGRLLDVVCADEGVTVAGKGPFLTLHPLDIDSDDNPPDPPSVAQIRDDESGDASSEAISINPDETHSEDTPRWNTKPLFDALTKAGWIPAAIQSSNGDDELLRKRLKDLGYL